MELHRERTTSSGSSPSPHKPFSGNRMNAEEECSNEQMNVAEACSQEKWSVVKELLLSRADVNTIDSIKGAVGLHFAVLHDTPYHVRLLLEYRCRIDHLDNDGLQPVHVAAYFNRVAAMCVLWEHDASIICSGDRDGDTPAHMAAHRGNFLVLEWLFLHGAAMTLNGGTGYTPLHWAVHKNRELAVQQLMAYDANVLQPDFRGHSALHLIATRGTSELLNMMLRMYPQQLCNLDSFGKIDCNGRTPVDLAKSWKMWLHFMIIRTWLRWCGNGKISLSFFLNILPRRYANAGLILLQIIIHVVNDLFCLAIAMPHLQAIGALRFSHRAVALTGLASQFFSLKNWAQASLTDPGFCEPERHADLSTVQKQEQEQSKEQISHAAESKFSEMYVKRQKILMELGLAHKDAPVRESVTPLMTTLLCGLKESLAGELERNSVLRRRMYPREYLETACGPDAIQDAWHWGKSACTVCGRLRTRRSKHCSQCGRCIAHFDHHCAWLGVCVAHRTLSPFMRYLAWTLAALSMAEVILFQAVVSNGPVTLETNKLRLYCFVLGTFDLLFSVLLLAPVLLRQIYLVMAGSTTYETIDELPALPKYRTWCQLIEDVLYVFRGNERMIPFDEADFPVCNSPISSWRKSMTQFSAQQLNSAQQSLPLLAAT